MSGTSTMRAAVLLGPERLEVRELPVPRAGPGELVLRIDAATTCGTDVKVFKRGGHPRMLRVPTVFGHEMAGTVAEVGTGVGSVLPGDAVVVANSAPCDRCRYCVAGRENLCEDLHYLNGAFAEFLRVPARFVARSTHRIPAGVDAARAALTEPLACVLHGIDACELERRAGRGPIEVLVLGAGPIGLLFVAALARDGHRVTVADPNSGRLETAAALGAATTVTIARGGGQAARLREAIAGGAEVAIECTGVPEVWADALASVHDGGLVNLFGGCALGTRVPLDTHRLHYGEITVKGVYHHRPETVRRALALLAEPDFEAQRLLSARRPVAEVEAALRSMMAKETLKVVIEPGVP
jgi:L-iditol 2-dehydrogenase